jgi:hypothetical protein
MFSYRKKRKARRTRKRSQPRSPFYIGGDTDKCLFVSVPALSGLGNQLFVYAAAIVAKNKIGLPLCILPTHNPHSDVDYRKELFVQGRPVEKGEMNSRRTAATRLLDKVIKPHNTWANTNIVGNTTKNHIIGDRFFQVYKPIVPAFDIIRKDCKKIFEEKYPGYKDTIPSTAAFMHIRKGDYDAYGSLGEEYYKKGLKILNDTETITEIHIISNDMPWSKSREFDKVSSKIKFAESDDIQKDELKTLYLMSLCVAGACMSASTFSVWGVILGAEDNPKSTILYPSVWFVDGNSDCMQFPERWQKITV